MSLGVMEHQQVELGAPLEIAVPTLSLPTKVKQTTTSTTSEMADGSKSPFFKLPPERRDMIYDYTLGPKKFYLSCMTRDPIILKINQQIRSEASTRFYRHSNFYFDERFTFRDALLWLITRPRYAIQLITRLECVYRFVMNRKRAKMLVRDRAQYSRELRKAGIVLRKGVFRMALI
ncbi:hypothetical protein LTR02_014435 [Friedmanniomyces endolithicus]|nr:hypothetical protein LTR94_016085 [Friedmanniomyces endolithicus]KAK0788718.1 hypothetical protein LTR59_009912 [Friedmanniomyces endolithicus]KAK0806600.1 hypothetical protein LTR75_006926 [Friedmanniomyces endolithicus]KAK0817476.1 hypothetical protein LTR38_001554 [Friedmanniomyces endolithicus]KAK0837928.1 hypothetical protein LTR03_012398 [Friedmanniomyces endolithicus]